MTYDPEKHHRRSIRLPGYDYTQSGAYFVTICAHERQCMFGEIVDGKMQLNGFGGIVEKWWREIPHHFVNVEIDYDIIMPNHFHGILWILQNRGGEVTSPPPSVYTNDRRGEVTSPLPSVYTNGRGGGITPPPRKPTLGQIIAYFKYQSTKLINEIRQSPGVAVWQRNYYEHIIRNEKDLNRIREYIINNPLRWQFDRENPNGQPDDVEKGFWDRLT